jgi:pilus assembly protein CpaC
MTMMTFRFLRRLASAALFATLLQAAPAAALDSPEPPVPPAAPRAKVIAVGAPEAKAATGRATPIMLKGTVAAAEPIRLSTNKTTEILLPAEVKDVIVGNPDIADVMVRSPTQLYLVGRAPGQTNVFLLDRAGNAIRRYEVDVAIDALALGEVLRDLLPDERSLKVSAVADSVYLSGTVRNDASAAMARNLARRFVANDANVVNMLRVANDQQVLIQVKVVEMQKSVLKQLGVGLSSPNAAPHVADITRLTNAKTGVTGLSSTFQALGGGSGLLDGAKMFGTAQIAGIGSLVTTLDFLENQGLVRTLVEPNLTAVSGETANMLAGGETPVPVAQQNGTISIEFKKFGVALSFTPVVLDAGRLSLKLATEVSSIDPSASFTNGTLVVSGFKVRRASSTVEMPSGGSLMIAGLLQNDVSSNVGGVPGLMDLPVLGALFRSTAFQRNESELVAIVSAYVVQPVDRAVLATPSDGFAPTSDIKRFLFGRLQETYTKRGADAPPVPGPLQGPFGYIVQ